MEDLEWAMDQLYQTERTEYDIAYESGYEQAMIDRIGMVRFNELQPSQFNIN
jgi:hypothetical protein